MRRLARLFLAHFLIVAAVVALAAPVGAGQSRLVYLSDARSSALFEQAADTGGFWPLMSAFTSEKHRTYCGVASSVMALNALGVPPPVAPEWYPYRYWDQDNLFSSAVLAVKSVVAVQTGGMTLADLGRILGASGARAEVVFAGSTDLSAFRQTARSVLRDGSAVLLVNVSREALGQEGEGHISPIAAYNAEADSFLFLDVARYKYPPAWIPADLLFAAMNTIDPDSQLTRGFVVVRK